MLLLPLFFVVVVWYLVICFKWKKNIFDLMEKMPGPKWYPIFGTSYFYAGAARSVVGYNFLDVVTKYGPFFRSWNGSVPEVNIMKPEHLQILMRSSVHTPKGPFYQYLFPWLGEGLFIAEGAKWFYQRKLLTPTFHFKILDGFTEVFAEKGQLLINKLQSKADGQYFNIVPDLAGCTLRIMCETSMGVPLKDITDKPLDYVQNIYSVTELAMWRYWNPYISDTMFHLMPQGKRFRRVVKELHAFSTKVIECRKELLRRTGQKLTTDEDSEKKRLSFMDLILDETDNKNTMSDSDLKALADTFLLAGYETTTNSICWTLFLLGNYPEVQERAYEEIRTALKDKPSATSIEDLNKLKYVECVVKEALRLYPIFPFMTRTVSENVDIDGHIVPAGTQAILHIYKVQRDPEHYPDPDRFDPDRFSPENSKTRHPFAYIPFSAGPRNCLGQRFATLEMKSIIATIIRKYKITSLETQEEMKLYVDLFIRPQTGIRIKLEERVE